MVKQNKVEINQEHIETSNVNICSTSITQQRGVRVGSHQLNIEALRGKIKDPKLRPCICEDTQPEDEFHFLITCTILNLSVLNSLLK